MIVKTVVIVEPRYGPILMKISTFWADNRKIFGQFVFPNKNKPCALLIQALEAAKSNISHAFYMISAQLIMFLHLRIRLSPGHLDCSLQVGPLETPIGLLSCPTYIARR